MAEKNLPLMNIPVLSDMIQKMNDEKAAKESALSAAILQARSRRGQQSAPGIDAVFEYNDNNVVQKPQKAYEGDKNDPYTINVTDNLRVRPEFEYGVYGSPGKWTSADPARNLYKGIRVSGSF